MKKIMFLAFCLTISLTSCRDDKKKETVKTETEAKKTISVETSKGSVKADDKGNVDVKIKDKN
ncbi:hypothetical protein LPB03_14395 [Polaribacter vadi]|uniref:Uncharacterized protein n=1 Tax=Polaribacter vadi TaxID=1774273 RepID=A0A1B8TQV0_9FLAO|nr:hypothetical protein [Polaribacter vadi]AOW18570.1 hypothetical protein LPB03_14395 [Polaribacter vadi]OBY62067.1 hypothetical protein LPB3_14910 [Polaribacter vadi]|tara:strand:+ start:4419 stop:4607 length:189 start_codon:yes stop_codon:yes gene_type:complete